MLNPEYGGDGVKTSGENAQEPVAAFGHIGPNGLLFLYRQHVPRKI